MISNNLRDLLGDIDTDDIKFVVTIGSELIKAGADILDTLKDKRDYSITELIDLSNASVSARDLAKLKAHEYIKQRIEKLESK